MFEVAGVNRCIVRVKAKVWILHLDHQFDHAVMLPGGEAEESVFVPRRLLENPFEWRHGLMLA